MTIRITGDGPKITATGSGSTVLVEISTGQHDPGSFSGVHNDLSGRSTSGAHVGTAVSIDPSGFAGNLDGTITNAQLLAAAVDDLTTVGGGGGADLSDTTPQALGTAAAGTGTAAARDDHVHAMPTAADVGAAATSHNHAASEVTSGTLDIARIPTGTTSTTVRLGNDAAYTDARTPTAHASTHAAAGADPVTLAQSQVTNLTTDLAGKVPTTRTVAGHALSGDVTITAADVGAQPVDSDLTTLAGLTPTTDSFIQAKSSAWAARTIAQVKADLAFPILTTAIAGQTYGMGGVVGSDSVYVNGLNKWWGGVTYLPAGSYDRVVFSVVATGTSTWSMGIYPLNPATGLVDAATAPIHNIGDVNLSLATGAISVTTSFTLAAPRLVWIGGSISAYTSAATIRTVGGTDAAVTRLEGAPLGGTIAGGVPNGALATGIRVLSGSGTAGINNFPAGGEFAAVGPKIQVRAA